MGPLNCCSGREILHFKKGIRVKYDDGFKLGLLQLGEDGYDCGDENCLILSEKMIS